MMKHLFGLVFVPFVVFRLAPPQQAEGRQKNMKNPFNISQKFFYSFALAEMKTTSEKKALKRHKKSYKFAFNQIRFLCFAKNAEKWKAKKKEENIYFQFQYIKNRRRLSLVSR